MNNRRKLVVALGAGALAAPFASLAQPAYPSRPVKFVVPISIFSRASFSRNSANFSVRRW